MQLPSLQPPPECLRRVLILDRNYRRRKHIEKLLLDNGCTVSLAKGRDDILDQVSTNAPDLLILETDPENLELCTDLRMIDMLRLTPIIMLSNHKCSEHEVVRALLAGADDVVAPARRWHELVARVRVQLRNRRDRELLYWSRQQCNQLHDEAMVDPLTGLANRRVLERVLSGLLDRLVPLVVCVIDVDYFKRVNDTYGHAIGDQVLQGVARALTTAARGDDLVARIGGEEFVVLAAAPNAEVSFSIAERLRRQVMEMQIPHLPNVTISVGVVAAIGGSRYTIPSLLQAADKALYEAKRSGRNCSVLGHIEGHLLGEFSQLTEQP